MRAKRDMDPEVLPATLDDTGASSSEALEQLRSARIFYDGVTGLPIHPFEIPERIDERIEHLGVIYLQIGKFFGFEELFGWEHYDRVLAAVSEVLQDDVRASRLAPHVHSIRFSGADGFFILYALPPHGRGRVPVSLEEEATRLRTSVGRRLRQTFEGQTADFITILGSSLTAADNARVRPSRHIIRTLQEAVKIVTQRQTNEKLELFAGLKSVIGRRQLRPAFQPVRHLPDGAIMGYEALIRGPQGTSLEPPTVLFAVAHENEMDVELETLCLELIFANLPRAGGIVRGAAQLVELAKQQFEAIGHQLVTKRRVLARARKVSIGN